MKFSRELLMRYHDGEVSEAEARDVEAALEQEPALLEELEAYAELGSFVRTWGEVSSQGHLDIADSVMSALEQRPDLRVQSRPTARVHSLLPRIATWVSLGAAIAAGSVLVVRSWSAPRPKPGAAHAVPTGYVVASAAAPEMSAGLGLAEEEPKPAPATIESVDFGTNTGTVFVVSTDSSETPVVWMPDDAEPDEDNEDRSESL